ncbi:hypothetical protein KY285_004859 [Solanum tuberosum]|nr:hypothetical protein KY289_005299 [Solanum tuberosum]KAH0751711.1 hypothetical protein KY285_004859 [Solanum tuberosum]
METTPSVTDVEVINNIPSTMSTISQQQGKVTPRRRIPPKKQKRATPPVAPNSGTTGRETSQIWDHFSKFIAKGDHTGETIAKGIEDCLLGWGIENLFIVTLDNATANDAAIKSLKGRIEDWKGVMFENQFLHVRCLLLQDFATFKSVVEKVKIDTHGLIHDAIDPNENIENDNCVMGESSDLLQSQWEKHMNKEGFVVKKSDLEIYLKDDVVKINDFNILSWWKVSSSRYPIVAEIARDILSIPISTIASESAFSTGGQIVDSYRSSLSPKMVEALICTQQWLRSPSKECKLEDIL